MWVDARVGWQPYLGLKVELANVVLDMAHEVAPDPRVGCGVVWCVGWGGVWVVWCGVWGGVVCGVGWCVGGVVWCVHQCSR